MSSHRRASCPVLLASLVSLWQVQEDEADELAPLSPLSQVGEEADPTATRRRRTPSFVCEVPLRVGPAEERVLQARLEAARALYNACLGEGRKRWLLMRQSRAYQHARMLPRHTPERTEAFTAAGAAQDFTEAALQAYAKDCRHRSVWIEDQLDAPVCQKLATRAYRAVMRLAVGKAKRVRFKGKHQLDSVEGKSNKTGLVWRSDRVVWRGLTLLAYLPHQRAQRDAVLVHGLSSRVKYVRLVRRRVGERTRYVAQLICEGHPYQKPKHTLGQGTVGLDLGPSTIAVVAETQARLEPFCAELDLQAAQIRREQRHLDRQRRANNPDNYLPNGMVKKGHKGRKHWRASQRQRKTQAHLADRQRRQAAHRKSLQGCLAHQVVQQGSTFLLEKVSYRAWQRRYGRSVQRRAPGMFVSILTHLAESAGGQVYTIPTRSTKLSQTCQCGRVQKKPLSQRVHACPECGVHMQRDLYSAYLIRFVDPETYLLHAGHAQEAWPGWEPILRAAWQQAHPTNQPASGRGTRSSSVRRRKAVVRQSWSSAAGSPANSKSSDVVPARPGEPSRGGGDVGQNLSESSGRVVQNVTPDISRDNDPIGGWQLMITDNRETDVRAAQESDLEAVYDVWYRTDVLTSDLTTTPPEKGPVPAYLRHVFATGKLVVAERNGEIVGFAGAVTRGEVVFLTDLFVDPVHQSGGLGKMLLRAALPSGDGLVHCTLSSSDPRAQAAYIRAGMAPAWPYFGLRLDVSATSARPQEPQKEQEVEVTQAVTSDIPELVKVDTERSGRHRPQEHTFWIQQEQAVPLWFRRQGRLIGYGYVRLGAGTIWHPRACAIGPVGAATAEEATACVLAAVEWAAERAPVLRIGVPGPHGSLAPLLKRGFQITYVDTFVSTAPAPFFDARRYIPSGGDLL